MHALLRFITEILLWDLQCDCRNQRGLFAVIHTQFASSRVDEFQLPGQQGKASVQRIQRLVVQLHGAGGVVDQVLDMSGKLADRLQGQGVGLFRLLDQTGFHAVNGVAVVTNQMQVVQAFFRLGQQHFSFKQKLGKCALPFICAVHHASLHNIRSGDEMPHRVNGLKLALKYDWNL